MDLKKNWYYNVIQNIKIQEEKIHKKDYKFFQIALLKDLAKLTQQFSRDCKHCESNKEEIEDITKDISTEIDTVSGRRNYTNRVDKITSHFKKTHKLYFRGYFLSIYTLIGMLVGTLTTVLIALLINVYIVKFAALVGFTIGLIVGRIVGAIKEKKLEKNNQFLNK